MSGEKARASTWARLDPCVPNPHPGLILLASVPSHPLPPLSSLRGREKTMWGRATESTSLFPRLTLLHQKENKGFCKCKLGEGGPGVQVTAKQGPAS